MSADIHSPAAPTVKKRSALQVALDRGSLVIQIVAVLGLFAILVQTLVHVVARYFFNSGVPNTLELVSGWYMPIVVFLGFVIAKVQREHIEARLIFDKLSPKNQRAFRIFSNVLAVTVTAIFAVQTFQMALHGMAIKETVGYAGLIVWPVFFIMPFAFAIMACLYLADLIDDIRGRAELTAHLDDAVAAAE